MYTKTILISGLLAANALASSGPWHQGRTQALAVVAAAVAAAPAVVNAAPIIDAASGDQTKRQVDKAKSNKAEPLFGELFDPSIDGPVVKRGLSSLLRRQAGKGNGAAQNTPPPPPPVQIAPQPEDEEDTSDCILFCDLFE
jgi:hypothetical protein